MTIRLQDIEMHAFHGVLEEERRLGNTFRVNVSMSVSDVVGVQTDRIEDTINYQAVYDIVAQEMAIPSQLLEHVVYRIRRALLAQWPNAEVRVAVSKKNPPLGGHVAWATVEI